MEPIRQIQKKYASRAMMTAIIIGLSFILAGHKPIGKGLILGTIFSVINFILIGETLPMRIGKSRAKTFFLSLSSIFFRYALMAVPLIVAINFKQFNLFAAIFGIFMIQIVILADHLLKIIWSNR
jgi:asparagine N-glycosylation enzyme membrane subunit Stt3